MTWFRVERCKYKNWKEANHLREMPQFNIKNTSVTYKHWNCNCYLLFWASRPLRWSFTCFKNQSAVTLPVALADGCSSASFPSSCAVWEGRLWRVACRTSFRASIWHSLSRSSVRVSLSSVFSWKISLSFWVTSAWESLSCCFNKEISPDFWQTWEIEWWGEKMGSRLSFEQNKQGIQISCLFPAIT